MFSSRRFFVLRTCFKRLFTIIPGQHTRIDRGDAARLDDGNAALDGGLHVRHRGHRADTFRALCAALTAFLVCLVLGPSVIRWLRLQKVGENIRTDSEHLNGILHGAGKVGTPTMGGILIVTAVLAGTVLFVDRSLPPYQGAYDFLDDVTAGRGQASFDRLCASDRDDPETAIAALNRRIEFGDEVTVNALSVDRDGDRATVEVIIDPGGSADTRHFDLPMREEGGDWKACPGDIVR